jgi:hypothetical protein
VLDGARLDKSEVALGKGKARGSAPGPRWGQGPQTAIF